MLKRLLTAVIGTRHEREMKRLAPLVAEIHREEQRLRDLPDDEIRAQTPRLREAIWQQTAAAPEALEEVRRAKHDCPDPAERERLEDRAHQLERDYKKAVTAALDEVLPEAYATVREACRRLLGSTVVVTGHELAWDMVPYDVQLLGGIVLHKGRIAEMATGEGKTLVATSSTTRASASGSGTLTAGTRRRRGSSTTGAWS